MFQLLGNFVSRNWLLTILFWIALVVVARAFAPKWDDVTHDGDLAYMPTSMPSVVGERLLEDAFPERRSRSEVVVVLARDDRKIDQPELDVLRSFVSRFQNIFGASCYEHSVQLAEEAEVARTNGDQAKADQLLSESKGLREQAKSAFDAAVAPLETQVLEAFDEAGDDPDAPLNCDLYFAKAAHNLALMHAEDGDETEAQRLRTLAWDVVGDLRESPDKLAGSLGVLPLVDVWSRFTDVYGSSLTSDDGRAELIFLRLSNEFMAADNIPFLEQMEALLQETKAALPDWPEGLSLGMSGSAAVGGDMLRSAKSSMRNTERYTIALVIGILLLVYRSPALIAVPLITIVVSLLAATSAVAALTQLHLVSGFEWWDFKIFTTTKIFVVVILFGAGTDYCLFLIARYKEELATGKSKETALADALGGVGEALAASAFTTIVGLGMMFFAQFGKFRNSGPTIGLCLLITLLACVTLAPALLRALGSSVNWTIGGKRVAANQGEANQQANIGWMDGVWKWLADLIVARPNSVLIASTLLMLPAFWAGVQKGNTVTYDLLSELDSDRTSKLGAGLLRQHFDVGQSGPVVVLAHKPGADFDSPEGIKALRELTGSLYSDGVQSVRSLIAPVGGKPEASTSNLLMQNHRTTRQLYLSKQPQLEGQRDGDVTRLELVLGYDPFSVDAMNVLAGVNAKLKRLSKDTASYWSGSNFAFAGTTAAISDLRDVTTSDNRRIQQLVVLAVLLILLILLKRPAVCIYLIISVLFSYYVTMGITQVWFQWVYAETYHGLDWKVPLFLFVILVAIGQDYNIYLATRVFEEQKNHGLFGGLREAITRTGGIITSCGVIMAGTFLSMMSGSLRGIAELGFALTLGVLLDTFVVRPILVPAFLAILFRWYVSRTPHLAAAGVAAIGPANTLSEGHFNSSQGNAGNSESAANSAGSGGNASDRRRPHVLSPNQPKSGSPLDS